MISFARWPQSLLRSIAFACAAVGSGVLFALGMSHFNRGPILQVDSITRELPPANDDVMTPHVTFALKSTGSAPVEIDRILSSCGCTLITLIKYPTEPIPPGEERQLEVVHPAEARAY